MTIPTPRTWRPVLVAVFTVMAWTLGPSVVRAQGLGPTHGYQSWLQLTLQGPIHEDLVFQGDVQYRAYEDFTPAWILLRGALAWRPTANMYLGLGYAWTPSWRARAGGSFYDEHRVFQNWQWELVHRETGIRFLMRFRVEERFRHPTSVVEPGVRVRQMLRLMVPLTTDRAWLLVVYDELFIDLTQSGRSSTGIDAMGDETFSPAWEAFGYDQNRAFAGLGYQVVESTLRLELGYMNQWIRRPNTPDGDAMNHVAVLNTVVNWQ